MNECTKCKRPGCDAGSNDPEANAECDGYVMGYRRGYADCLEMAHDIADMMGRADVDEMSAKAREVCDG